MLSVVFLMVVLSVAFSYCYAECHYAECRYAECRGVSLVCVLVSQNVIRQLLIR